MRGAALTSHAGDVKKRADDFMMGSDDANFFARKAAYLASQLSAADGQVLRSRLMPHSKRTQ
ncbi:hypothetical protein CNO08_22030 [Lysobacter capsici]|nr:hypothetical protein CNO08_22030 [Lysobacter capsici]